MAVLVPVYVDSMPLGQVHYLRTNWRSTPTACAWLGQLSEETSTGSATRLGSQRHQQHRRSARWM